MIKSVAYAKFTREYTIVDYWTQIFEYCFIVTVRMYPRNLQLQDDSCGFAVGSEIYLHNDKSHGSHDCPKKNMKQRSFWTILDSSNHQI